MPAKLPAQILDKALKLQARLWTHPQIAEELGISVHTLNRHLARINRRAKQKLQARADAIKAKQIAQLETLAHEAFQGWERSKKEAKEVKRIKGKDKDGNPIERTEVVVKGQAGDPSFIKEARGALADIRKTLGLNASDELARERLKKESDATARESLIAAEARGDAFDNPEPGGATPEDRDASPPEL